MPVMLQENSALKIKAMPGNHDIQDRDILEKRSNTLQINTELDDQPISYTLLPHVSGQGYQNRKIYDLADGWAN